MLATVLGAPFALTGGWLAGVPDTAAYVVGLAPSLSIDAALGFADGPGGQDWRLARMVAVGALRIIVLRSATATALPPPLRARALFTLTLPAGFACLPALRGV